jgi:hypothetical protein
VRVRVGAEPLYAVSFPTDSGQGEPGEAWRWPVAGKHTIEILAGIPNAKEGTSFFHMTGYDLVR